MITSLAEQMAQWNTTADMLLTFAFTCNGVLAFAVKLKCFRIDESHPLKKKLVHSMMGLLAKCPPLPVVGSRLRTFASTASQQQHVGMRVERDTMGPVEVPADRCMSYELAHYYCHKPPGIPLADQTAVLSPNHRYWGAQTQRSLQVVNVMCLVSAAICCL